MPVTPKELIERLESTFDFTYCQEVSEVETALVANGYELFEELEWADKGKYQEGGDVYACVAPSGDTYFVLLPISRSGSHFSGYNYLVDKPIEVKRVEKTIFSWEKI